MFALLVIAQVLACHVVLSGSSPVSAMMSSQHDVGHDTCEPAVALAAPAVRSTARECAVSFRVGDVLAVIALMSFVGGVAFTNGSPRWAPRPTNGGRSLLVRLQVIRV